MKPRLLASAYRESIRVADELELNSIAFPSISTGVYGYPIDEAAQIALQTVVETLANPRAMFNTCASCSSDPAHITLTRVQPPTSAETCLHR